MINKHTGVNLYLANIQLRIAYPSSKGSYINCGRNPYFFNNHSLSGNIPPVYKIIYFSPLGEQETLQLGALNDSYNLKLIRS